jgi:transcription elongation factor GreA
LPVAVRVRTDRAGACMQKEVALTPEGQTRLEQELIHLETVRRREVGERIKEAKEFGDISENSEYDDAKNEQAWVESRIIEINVILAHATIIQLPKRRDKVTLGSKIHLRDTESNEVHTYQLVGPH